MTTHQETADCLVHRTDVGMGYWSGRDLLTRVREARTLDNVSPRVWFEALSACTDAFAAFVLEHPQQTQHEQPTRIAELEAELALLRPKAEAYDRINTPEIDDFLSAVKNEALHQRERWGVENDGGKEDADWFWLVGYLAGKALHDVKGKRLHHIITAAAALLNWHAHAYGTYARMRPGIDAPREAIGG